MVRRSVWLSSAACTLAASAGCSALLGDFSTGSSAGAGSDGGSDTGTLVNADSGNSQGNGDGATGSGGDSATSVSDGAASDGTTGDASSFDASDSAPPPGCTGPTALHCGPYATCNPGPVCACVPGYVSATDGGLGDAGDDAGIGCTWAGLPLDPAFENTPPNAWTITNATFAPTAPSPASSIPATSASPRPRCARR